MKAKWKIYIVIITLILVVESSYLIGVFAQKKYFADKATEQLNQFSDVFHKLQTDEYLYLSENLKEISNSDVFYNYIKALYKDDSLAYQKVKQELEKYLLKFSFADRNTKYIKFIDIDGFDKILIKQGVVSDVYKSNKDEKFYKKISQAEKMIKFVYEKMNNDFLVVIANPIFVDSKKIGILLSIHEFNKTANLFKELAFKGIVDNVFVTTILGEILYANDAGSLQKTLGFEGDFVPKSILNEGKHLENNNLVIVKNDEELNVKLFTITYAKTIRAYAYDMLTKFFTFFIVSGIIAFFLFLWIVTIVSKEFKKSFKKISTSENYLQTVLYMMNNLFFVLDNKTLKIEHVNRATLILLGYEEKDLIGKNLVDIIDKKKTGQNSIQIFNMNKIVNNLEFVLTNKAGKGVPVKFSSSIVEEYLNERKRKIICIALDISKQKDTEKELEFFTHHDVLTKLANRMDFDEMMQKEMSRTLRVNCKFALFYIDLDGFKDINDKYGHAFGDTLLQEVAKRLKSSLRREDVIFRMGGDEFTAIITNIQETKHIGHVAQNMLNVIDKVFVIDDKRVSISASIGISIFPIDTKNAQELIKKADQAMYLAKQAGKNTYKFCSY